MEFVFCPLFSGSNGNALFLRAGDTRILIDAGVSGARVKAALAAMGEDAAALDAILVTHEHSDHVSGVGVLTRRYGIPVYATAGTWAAMASKIGDISGANERIIEPGGSFCVGRAEIEAFATPHDAASPVDYAISAGGVRVACATDIGAVRKEWLARARGAQLVLLEANHDVDALKAGPYPYELKRRILGAKGHLSNEDAGKAALELVKSGTTAVVLGHLSGENNFPELARETVALALREGGVAVGRDVRLDVARREGGNSVYTIAR